MNTQVLSIEKELKRVNEEVRSDDAEFGTVANNNVIIIASQETPTMRLDAIISAFTKAHPSRFFILKHNDAVPDISVFVSALCHSLGSVGKVCSEIITLQVPTTAIEKLSSIVRANLLSGRLTELLIADDTAATKLYAPIASTCDVVYLDSSSMHRGIEAVQKVEDQVSRVVDLSWIRLAPWREAIKSAFDKAQLASQVEKICEVSIRYHPLAKGSYCANALLFAGWVITRLSADILSVNSNTIHCRTAAHKSLVLSFEETSKGKNNSLHQVSFGFDGTGDITLRVTMDADGRLETVASTEPPLRFEQTVQELDEDALLAKHFLIGESTIKFNASLECALLIFDRLVRRT